MFDLFSGVTAAIMALVKVLRLRKPGKVFLKLTREEDMLRFVLVLPPPSAFDVVTRRLNFQIGDGEPTTQELDGKATVSEELSGEEGNGIVGSLVDVDDAGNASEPRDFEFTLADTLAPPQPGEVGVLVTAEEPTEPPVEEEEPPTDPTV